MGNTVENQYALRVIKIFPKSPAAATDLQIYTDFIVNVKQNSFPQFNILRDFYKLAIQEENNII